MVNYFTKDEKIFPPNSPPVIGQLAISELTSQYKKFRITEFSEENTAFYGNEDYLIDEGNYFMSYGKDNTVEKGRWRMESISQYLEHKYACNYKIIFVTENIIDKTA